MFEEGRGRPAIGRVGRESVDERTLGDRLAGPEGLTKRGNTFLERVVLQEFAPAAPAGAHVAEVRAQAERFAARDEVIPTIAAR